MQTTSLPSIPLPRHQRDWLSRALGVVLLIGAGVLLGVQFVFPEKRTIAVLVALVVFGIAWRIDMVSGICLLALLLPFPRGMVFGSSTIAFILLLLVIWFLRIGQRQSPGPRRTPIDLPVAGLLVAYVLSYSNVTRAELLPQALQNTNLAVSCILMFYLIVSNLRTERDLQKLHAFQAVSTFAIMALATWELSHPGSTFIRGWIQFPGSAEPELNIKNVRVGGPFFDYELLSEFCALNLLLVTFLFLRARTLLRRTLLAMLAVLTTFILFATVTRGGIISLGIGVAYLLWVVRRRLSLVPFALASTAVVLSFLFMDFFVSNFTKSGDLIARLMGTQLYGLVPDSRVMVWQDAWERFLEHPILGHGPVYTQMTGTRVWFWPHNGYLLIANLLGVVGLGFFLGILWKLFRATLPPVHTLQDPSYSRSYLLIAHTQLIVFMIDQVKIDYLRNPIYQFQVWLLFAMLASASLIARRPALATAHPS